MKKLVIGLFIMSYAATTYAVSENRVTERAQNAAEIIQKSVSIPDNAIPIRLLEKASCIAVFPHVIRAGLVFGAKYGKGITSCRVAQGWSMPSYFTIVGGSYGLQIGLSSTDLVLVFVHPEAMTQIGKAKLTLDGNASVAAGPLGRDAQIGTDFKLDSQIYAYSRSRGLFAGLTINGSVLSVDEKANEVVYGPGREASHLLVENSYQASSIVRPFIDALETYAR